MCANVSTLHPSLHPSRPAPLPMIAVLSFALLLSACSRQTAIGSLQSEAAASSEKQKSSLLAYSHQLRIEAEPDNIAPFAQQIQSRCNKDEHCEVLEMQLGLGRSNAAHIKMRAGRESARRLLAEISQLGKPLEQSSSAEDLAGPITDAAKQKELLLDYRQRLEGLRERAKSDIDTLIKLNKELSQVQSELESLNGRYAHLQQRVNTELVTVEISSNDQNSVSAPLKFALRDFASNFAQGTASAITGLAYLLPWSVLLSICFMLTRKLWRRRKDKSTQIASSKPD